MTMEGKITVYVCNVQSEGQCGNYHLEQSVVIYPKAAWLTSYSSLPKFIPAVVSLEDVLGVQKTSRQ